MFKPDKKLRLRVLGAVVSVAAVAAALTGCSAASTSSSGSSGSLTYWSMWKQGEPQQVVLAKAIKGFTEKTGIKVDVQWAGRQVIQQVIPRLSAGNPPDLFDSAGSGITSAFANNDGLLGLQSVYNSTPYGEKEKISSIISPTVSGLVKTKSGEPEIVPYEITGTSLWYNQLTVPQLAGKSSITWSQFMSIADKQKDAGTPPIALDGDQAYYDAYWFVLDAIRHGGANVLVNLSKDKTGAAADNPAILAAAKDIFPLTQGGYLPSDFNGTKWPAQEDAWAAGTSKTSFLAMGSWAPSETASGLQKSGLDPATTIQYGSLPYPTVSGGKGNSLAWIDDFGFAIPKKAKNAANAEKFIEYFMAKKQLQGISSVATNLTPRSDIPVPPDLADFAKEYQAAAKAGTLTNNPDAGITNAQWSGQVLDQTVAYLFNKKFSSPEAFVSALKARTVTFLQTQG